MHLTLIAIFLVLLVCKLSGLAIAWWVVLIPLMLIAAFWGFMLFMLIAGIRSLSRPSRLAKRRAKKAAF